MCLTSCRGTACRSGYFFGALFEGGQLYEQILLRQRKIAPGQGQRFVNPCAGIPQRRQQHPAVQIRHIMKPGAHFRCQQVFRQFVLTRAI